MTKLTNIGDITIEHNDNVPLGLDYIRDNWGTPEVEKILATTKEYADHLCHFEANGMRYVLMRVSQGRYVLEPAN